MLIHNEKNLTFPLLREPEIEAHAIEAKVDRVAKASFCSQVGKAVKALLTSRVVWAIGLTIGTVLLLAFLASNPFGWI